MTAVEVVECTACREHRCSHGERCPMMIKWYTSPWDGTFWRFCTCDAGKPEYEFPVTVRRITPEKATG